MGTAGSLLWASLHDQGAIFGLPRWAEGQETQVELQGLFLHWAPQPRTSLKMKLGGERSGSGAQVSKLHSEPFWSKAETYEMFSNRLSVEIPRENGHSSHTTPMLLCPTLLP